MIIYSATFPNGKTYIGKTTKCLKDRKYHHMWQATKIRHNYPFYKAIRKYGVENINWEVEATAVSKESLNKLETYFILAYNTLENGYNHSLGG